MEFQRQLRDLKVQRYESEQKVLHLEKTVQELSNNKSGVKLTVWLLVLIGFLLLIVRGKFSPLFLCIFLNFVENF